MQRLRILAITAMLLTGLAGCSDTLRTQAAGVMHLTDGTEWVMTGDSQMDFELSSLTRLTGDGIICEMPMEMRLDRSGERVAPRERHASGELSSAELRTRGQELFEAELAALR